MCLLIICVHIIENNAKKMKKVIKLRSFISLFIRTKRNYVHTSAINSPESITRTVPTVQDQTRTLDLRFLLLSHREFQFEVCMGAFFFAVSFRTFHFSLSRLTEHHHHIITVSCVCLCSVLCVIFHLSSSSTYCTVHSTIY